LSSAFGNSTPSGIWNRSVEKAFHGVPGPLAGWTSMPYQPIPHESGNRRAQPPGRIASGVDVWLHDAGQRVDPA
jgi:hypothetical protein